jgi:methylglutaconyl-CoA hydratase
MASQGFVNSETADGIARITFHHPQSNSLPGDLLRRLAAVIGEAGASKDTRVILLQSEGERAFCAGASFDELLAIENLEQGRVFFSGFAAVINAMRKVPCFVVCVVQGKTVGGGVGVASAADYCLAHESASVKLSELAVGIGPFVVGPAVERKMGRAAYTEMTIAATQWKSAAWAREKGLFADVFPTREALDEAAGTLAATLARSNPDSMRALKRIFWDGTEHWDELLAERARISGELVLSDFAHDAISAFKNKKK